MISERRRSARHPVELDITMRYRQRRFPVAQARDLSPEGMYVQTANLTLPTGTLIEIELDRWGRQWLIPAMVTHSDARGVGLIFRTSQPDLYEYAIAALLATRPCATGSEALAIPT